MKKRLKRLCCHLVNQQDMSGLEFSLLWQDFEGKGIPLYPSVVCLKTWMFFCGPRQRSWSKISGTYILQTQMSSIFTRYFDLKEKKRLHKCQAFVCWRDGGCSSLGNKPVYSLRREEHVSWLCSQWVDCSGIRRGDRQVFHKISHRRALFVTWFPPIIAHRNLLFGKDEWNETFILFDWMKAARTSCKFRFGGKNYDVFLIKL